MSKIVFQSQNWCITFMEFFKALLAFETPKSGIYIYKIGICDAKRRHKKCPKVENELSKLAF